MSYLPKKELLKLKLKNKQTINSESYIDLICTNKWTLTSLLKNLNSLSSTNVQISPFLKDSFLDLAGHFNKRKENFSIIFAEGISEGIQYAKSSLLIEPQIEISVLSDTLDVLKKDNSKDKFLTHFSKERNNHCNILFSQRQKTSHHEYEFVHDFPFNLLAHHPHRAELVIRNSNTLLINMNILSSNTYTSPQNSSIGVSDEYFILLCKMIGNNPKLNSVCFYNYNHSFDNSNTSKLLADSIWYLIEGLKHRKKTIDFEPTQEVVLENEGTTISFLKEQTQNRWWAKMNNSSLFPVSIDEFKDAKKGIINDILFKQIEKYV